MSNYVQPFTQVSYSPTLSPCFTIKKIREHEKIDQNSCHVDACAMLIQQLSLEVCGIAIQLGQIVHDLWGRGTDLARQLHLLGGGQVRVLKHQVAVHDAATRIAQVASRAPDCAEHWKKILSKYVRPVKKFQSYYRAQIHVKCLIFSINGKVAIHIEEKGPGRCIMNRLSKNTKEEVNQFNWFQTFNSSWRNKQIELLVVKKAPLVFAFVQDIEQFLI